MTDQQEEDPLDAQLEKIFFLGSSPHNTEYVIKLLKRHVPLEIFKKYLDKILIVGTPHISLTYVGAAEFPADGKVLRPEEVSGRYVIVISDWMVPMETPAPNRCSREYFVLIILHELAHVYHDHPRDVDRIQKDEKQASWDTAIKWFNETSDFELTEGYLSNLRETVQNARINYMRPDDLAELNRQRQNK